MKTCSKCKVPKEESCFYACKSLSSRVKDGLQRWCKSCMAGHFKEYRKNPAVRERKRQGDRERYRLNPEPYRKQVREYAASQSPESKCRTKATRREYNRKKYVSNPQYRMRVLISHRQREEIKFSGGRKTVSAMRLTGCTITELKNHFETLFRPGMTWENYGPVWHIDHIKPCAKFDLTDPEQQKLCFHWTNLQPLFAKENLAKGDTYNG